MPWGADEQLPSLPTKRLVSDPIILPSQKMFNEQVKPLLIKLAQIKSVYWFAGNIDSRHIHNSYYWKDSNSELTVIATAITDSANDMMINVQISELGVVRIIPVSLDNGTVTTMSQYAAARWDLDTKQWRSDHPQRTFTQYFKSKTKEVLLSKKFAAGIFGGLAFGVLLMMYRRPTRLNRQVASQNIPLVEPEIKPTAHEDQTALPTPVKRAA